MPVHDCRIRRLVHVLLFLVFVSLTATSLLRSQSAKPKTLPPVGGPVRLPDPHIPGFVYPEPEATVLKRVNANDQTWITKHAWGIWTALTLPIQPGSSTLAYETWLSPVPGGVMTRELFAETAGGKEPTTAFHLLQRPPQFHGKRFVETAPGAIPPTSDQVLVTVNWSPEMVREVQLKQLLSSATLNKLLASGVIGITLNNRSLTLKPTYLWLNPAWMVQGRYFQVSTWPGPPNPAAPFPSNLWNRCVWVDVQQPGAGTGTGAVDTTCSASGSSRTAQNTYGLANFIHFTLTAQEAKKWNEQGNSSAKAGDKVILVAMHVSTREITEWAWQTFWWEPNPAKPAAPSSTSIAALRPTQLKGAARHYAQCSAYQMVNPNQPTTGGTGTYPHLCFNPYLEAPFSPTDLPDSKPWTYQGTTYNLNVGVQTNCMSCHIQATFPQDATAPQYSADQYIDLNAPAFAKHLKMDFAWSIVQNVK